MPSWVGYILDAICTFISESCAWAAWLVLSDCMSLVPGLKPDESEVDFAPEDPSCAAKVAAHGCKIAFNLMVTSFLAFLYYLIYFHPYSMRPRVDTAVIGAFDLNTTAASGSTLRYDFSLDVTFYNENRLYGVRFDHLTAAPYFNGTKLGPPDDTLPDGFLLPKIRHKKMHPVLRGTASSKVVSAAMAEEFAKERADGTFAVDIRLKTTLTYQAWPTKSVYYYVYDCWLHFPAAPNKNNHTAALLTAGVKCHPSKSK